ncbi:hypothetical protein GEMRC1_010265 [Eukaryota sp. GEM-RC1]
MSELSSLTLTSGTLHNHFLCVFKQLLQVTKVSPRFDRLSYVCWYVIIFQVIGFVTRTLSFPAIFDIQPFLRLVSLPIYDNYILISPTILLTSITVICLILTTLVLVISLVNCSHRLTTVTLILLSLIAKVVLEVLFFPIISYLFSFLPCQPPSPSSLSFTQDSVDSSCSNASGIIQRVLILLLIAFFLFIRYVWTLTTSDNPFSKRIFSSSHTRAQSKFLIVQVVIISFFFLAHHRYWEFRVIYLLGSLYVSYVYFKCLPFYKSHVNIKVMIGFGLWVGTAVAFWSLVYQSVLFNWSIW